MGRRDHKRSRTTSAEKLSRPSPEAKRKKENVHSPQLSTKKSNEEDNLLENISALELPTTKNVILTLRESSSVAVQGKFQVKCVFGSCKIFGYDLSASDDFLDIFSTETSSYLTIRSTDGQQGQDLSKGLFNYIKEFETLDPFDIDTLLEQSKSDRICILHIKPLSSASCEYIKTVSSYKNILFNSKVKIPRHSVSSPSKVFPNLDVCISRAAYGKNVRTSGDFEYVAKKCMKTIEDGSPLCLAACGGKNVGKSTLCRYLLNSLLNGCKEVAYIECDVGQTEFTPSCCVSLNVVSAPLLGPPFTHIKRPECSVFVGLLSPGDDPSRYMKSLEYLFNEYSTLENRPPLIVNTMGWNKGLGLNILVDTLKLFKPNMIVQLDSKSRSKNLPNLSPEFFENSTGWRDISGTSESKMDIAGLGSKYSHVVIHSPVNPENESSDRFKAVDHRNLTLLAYFSQKMENPRTLRSIQPYKIPWSSVAVHVIHANVPNSQILHALNASVVGLCTIEETTMIDTNIDGLPKFLKETPVCHCIGQALIRAIDPEEKVFYVITPVPIEELKRVNCFLRGALELPQAVFMDQLSSGSVPYIGFPNDVIGSSSVSRRRHMQRHRPT